MYATGVFIIALKKGMCMTVSRKWALSFIVVSTLIIAAVCPVQAATPAGTAITAVTAVIQYSDGQAYTTSHNVTLPVSTTVMPIYGLTVTPHGLASQDVNFTETAYYNHILTNAGNTPDTFNYTMDSMTSAWSATLYLDNDNSGTFNGGDTEVTTINIPGESTKSVLVAFTAPTTAYNTPGKVVFHSATVTTPSGTYIGYNGTTYGAPAEAQVTDNARIAETIAPTVTPVSPVNGQQMVVLNSMVVFDITDIHSGVNISTILVTVNGTAYVPTYESITDGYRVTADPADFNYSTTINVSVQIADVEGNVQNFSYAFRTLEQAQFDLTMLIDGYYVKNFPATMNIQFRPVQNIDSGITMSLVLDGTGHGTAAVNGDVSGSYYVVIRQDLVGLPLGVNHLAFCSSENIAFIRNQAAQLNLSDDTSPYYYTPFIPGNGTSPMVYRPEISKWVLKGGDATGEKVINITDIVNWENAASNPLGDQRGKAQWSEKANFDGDNYLNTDDFSVWNRSKGQKSNLPENEPI